MGVSRGNLGFTHGHSDLNAQCTLMEEAVDAQISLSVLILLMWYWAKPFWYLDVGTNTNNLGLDWGYFLGGSLKSNVRSSEGARDLFGQLTVQRYQT